MDEVKIDSKESEKTCKLYKNLSFMSFVLQIYIDFDLNFLQFIYKRVNYYLFFLFYLFFYYYLFIQF